MSLVARPTLQPPCPLHASSLHLVGIILACKVMSPNHNRGKLRLVAERERRVVQCHPCPSSLSVPHPALSYFHGCNFYELHGYSRTTASAGHAAHLQLPCRSSSISISCSSCGFPPVGCLAGTEVWARGLCLCLFPLLLFITKGWPACRPRSAHLQHKRKSMHTLSPG